VERRLRTITYFHNMIGILTEIIGSPTPMTVPAGSDKQLPQGDWPMPIDARAVALSPVDRLRNHQQSRHARSRVALSRDVPVQHLAHGHELHRKGQQGLLDRHAEAHRRAGSAAAAKLHGRSAGRGGVARRWAIWLPAAVVAGGGRGGGGRRFHGSLQQRPARSQMRDPRGYILPSDQPDFATATEFINALLKNGVTCLKATSAFQVAGKSYPAGSYVVKTAQAFRPHVMDMFEPQDHPNDFAYPGGPPNRPYDITGWTLAMQMGVKYDRIPDGFDGPFEKINGLLPPPASTISGPASPAGYLISHEINNSFILTNRLLKAGGDVYWIKQEQTVTAGVSAPARSGFRLPPRCGRFSIRPRRSSAFRCTRWRKRPPATP
jgi:hypothetical protein